MSNIELKPVVFKTCLGYAYFDYHQIIMVEARGNCSFVFTDDETSPVRVLHNLSFISLRYCNNVLFRCHKSFIINLNHVKKLEIKTCKIYLINGLMAPLSDAALKIIRRHSLNEFQK